MKISNVFLAMLGVVAVFGASPVDAAGNNTPALKIENREWSAPGDLKGRLGAILRQRVTDLSPEQMRAFIRRPENLNLLLNRHLAWSEANSLQAYENYRNGVNRAVTDKENECNRLETAINQQSGTDAQRSCFNLGRALEDLEELRLEAQQAVSLSEVISRPEAARIFAQITANNEWMEQIAFSGELHKPGRVFQIITSMGRTDSQALRQRVTREAITATALEYARNDWSFYDAVNRANHFVKYWREGRLNTVFDDIPFWQRRVVCGWKNHHSSGTPEAFVWALENIHLPDWQYPACCWRCGYILDNVFGDSIHGRWYVAPFIGVYDRNHFLFTKNVGGVCGGLSHFGAAAACANGVPALTAGEPGHCAYIVCVNGKWTPAYSLSWERGLHWLPWSNNYTYSSLHLTTDLNSAEQADRTRLSNAYRIMAHVYVEHGDMQKALTCFERSAEAQPLNFPMWREYANFVRTQHPRNVQAWMKLNDVLCRGMASVYPEQAAELCKNSIYGPMKESGISAADMRRACVTFWANAKVMGPDRWYLENFLNTQLNNCKALSQGNQEEAVCQFYAEVMAAAAAHEAFAAPVMAWGNGIAGSLSENGRKLLNRSMISAISSGNDLTSQQKAVMLGGLMLTAARNRDDETFRALARMVDPELVRSDIPLPAPHPFPGKLVSEGGMPFTSSTSQWDVPHTHAGLLTQQGGKFHTGRDTNAWVAVKLPRHAHITGVVFAGTNNWSLIGRFRPLRVQVSDTGRDDDWHDVGQPIPSTGNYINRFDLQQERPRALYVRVLRGGGPEYFHGVGLFVYGEPAA